MPQAATGTVILDVSHHQGNLNWETLLAAHQTDAIGGVLMKASQGDAADPMFTRNQSAARALGVPRGYYHFASPATSSGATQARAMARIVGPLQPGEVVALDLETNGPRTVQTSDVAWALEFLATLEGITGARPLLYLAGSTVRAFNWAPVATAGYPLWVAAYGRVDTGRPGTPPSSGAWPNWAMWQYTSVGSFAGIHPVDASLINGDFRALGLPAPPPVPQPNPPQPTQEQKVQYHEAMKNVDELYLAYRGAPISAKERSDWGRDLAVTVFVKNEDPLPTLCWIEAALRDGR
jgi:GH25 family lysozyme M1 (1,4-beta-N-acetylmuramidase)